MMNSLRGIGWVLLLILSVSCSSSSSVSLEEDPEAYAEEVARLQERIAERPSDATALRDLGAIYMRTQRPARAYDTLKKAFSRDPRDPKTLFYLGLASESVGKRNAALRIFKKYDEVPESSDYHRLMEGRYEWLVRQQAREDIRDMLARERQLADRGVSPRVVAVMPLRYQGGDSQYEPLGRGLAEMMMSDLANVRRLKVVERVRLQALIDELKLGQTDAVDASTAPRVGRLLGAGRLVGGSYNVTGDERLRMDVTLAELDGGLRFPDVDTQAGRLEELFRLQKQLVFRVVDVMGVDLTRQERASIEYVPTENLQSFLAYSRGLLDEDRGNFSAAAEHYGRSQSLDPGFEAPRLREKKMEGLSAAAGSRERAMTSASQVQVGTTSIDLMNQRLRNMGYDVTQSPDPSRDPAQEGASVDEGILPDAPEPPSNGGTGGN